VLDIEDSGGLSRAQLRRWARRWLDRVHDRTGLRAMIYSGNHFWRGSMGNTASFARSGHPEWIAHWYVRRPEIPARNWGGRGWTLWQWSAVGGIPGIRGDVDLDWLRGRDLRRATIASLAVSPAQGGTIIGPGITCGLEHDRCTGLVNPLSSVTLRARPDRDARFLRWTGACSAAGTDPTCTVTALGAREVSAIFGYPTDASRAEVAGCGRVCLAATFPLGPVATFASGVGGCARSTPECTIAVLLASQLQDSNAA
jgi:hypothetical protein